MSELSLLNINHISILDFAMMLLDADGFILKGIQISRDKIKTFTAGRGVYTCKDFCRNIPKKDSRKVSYTKTKEYYCATCEIAMKCVRCKCCGRMGRREPRTRNRFTRAILNGTKYIE